MELSYIHEALRPFALPVDRLTPDPENARTHDAESVQAIKASLTRFGQDVPLVVQRQGMIIRKGNGRYLAARELGWSHVACIVVNEGDVEAAARAAGRLCGLPSLGRRRRGRVRVVRHHALWRFQSGGGDGIRGRNGAGASSGSAVQDAAVRRQVAQQVLGEQVALWQYQ